MYFWRIVPAYVFNGGHGRAKGDVWEGPRLREHTADHPQREVKAGTSRIPVRVSVPNAQELTFVWHVFLQSTAAMRMSWSIPVIT